MHETQQTINDWADQTFGPLSSVARAVARANEEVAELIRYLATDTAHPKAGEEIADALIVLCRPATRLSMTLDFSTRTLRPTHCSVIEYATWAAEVLTSAIRYLARNEDCHARSNLDECVSLLIRAASTLSVDVQAVIDAKMAVNRARTWNLDGTGHGYHVKGEVAR